MVATDRRPWLGITLVFLLSGCSIDRPVSSAGSSPSAAVPSTQSTPAVVTTAPTPVSDGFGVLPGTPPGDFEGGVTCSGAMDPGDPVAIVQLRGIDEEPGETVLLDFVDPSAPRTVCTFGGSRWLGARFVDGRHVVISSPTDASDLYLVIDIPEVRYHWVQLPPGADASFPSMLAAVSPELDRLIWVSHEGGTAGDAVHVTTAASDRVIANLRDTNEGRCGDPDDSNVGGFAPSGSLAYVLNRPLAVDAGLVVVDGEDIRYRLLAPKDGWPVGDGPAMAVWSPTQDTLYFRNGDDVWTWTADAGATKFLPGVRWSMPTISPDGTYLAYAELRPDGLPDVYLVDLANGPNPERLGTGRRNLPAFLGNTQLWYMGTEDTPGCEGGSERTPLVYSLEDASETPSPIEAVIATWPATSSNH